MRLSTMLLTGFVVVGIASLAFANPSMLPNHPGYPSEGEFANDTGQKNLTVEQSRSEAAASEDAHSMQKVTDPNNKRLLESQGAGQLPLVQGPDITIEPPVASATDMSKQ